MCHFFSPAFLVKKPGWWSNTPAALETALLDGREISIPYVVTKSSLKLEFFGFSISWAYLKTSPHCCSQDLHIYLNLLVHTSMSLKKLSEVAG